MGKQEELYQQLKNELGEEIGNQVILEMAPTGFGVDDYQLEINRRKNTTEITIIIHCMEAFIKAHVIDFRNSSFKVNSMMIFHNDIKKMQEMSGNNQ